MANQKTVEELTQENKQLRDKVDSLARDLADYSRDEIVYREEIYKLRLIIEELKGQ